MGVGFVFRVAAWLVFGASIAMMVASALLASRQFRDMLADMWIRVAPDGLTPEVERARSWAVVDATLAALYLNRHGRVSLAKTLGTSWSHRWFDRE
jgi:hypothetical protein